MIYNHIASRLTAKGKLKLDAALGDPDAVASIEAERRENIAAAGFKVAS